MLKIPVRRHSSFDADHAKLPEAVAERLNSFFRQVAADPDEQSILEVCGNGPHDSMAYPLGEGWVVYWQVVREKSYYTTIQPPRPIRVELLGFHQFPEFIRVKLEAK